MRTLFTAAIAVFFSSAVMAEPTSLELEVTGLCQLSPMLVNAGEPEKRKGENELFCGCLGNRFDAQLADESELRENILKSLEDGGVGMLQRIAIHLTAIGKWDLVAGPCAGMVHEYRHQGAKKFEAVHDVK